MSSLFTLGQKFNLLSAKVNRLSHIVNNGFPTPLQSPEHSITGSVLHVNGLSLLQRDFVVAMTSDIHSITFTNMTQFGNYSLLLHCDSTDRVIYKFLGTAIRSNLLGDTTIFANSAVLVKMRPIDNILYLDFQFMSSSLREN